MFCSHLWKTSIFCISTEISVSADSDRKCQVTAWGCKKLKHWTCKMINTPTTAVACYDDSGLEQRSTHYVISAPHTPTHTCVCSHNQLLELMQHTAFLHLPSSPRVLSVRTVPWFHSRERVKGSEVAVEVEGHASVSKMWWWQCACAQREKNNLTRKKENWGKLDNLQ